MLTGQTDGRTPDHYSTLSARRGWRNKLLILSNEYESSSCRVVGNTDHVTSFTAVDFRYRRRVLTTRQQVGLRQWELTYIHTCRPTSARRAIFHERHISYVTFAVCLPIWKFTSRWLADSSDVGLLGSKVPQHGRFPDQDADETLCKIWRC